MDVGDWLRSLGLGQHEALFRENEIDAEVLPELTDGDLEKIGVPLGHRKRLLKAIANLGAAEAPAKPTIPPPTASSRDVAEHRPITVMFCDLVGSTSLAAKLDPEDWRNLVGSYLDAASAAVTSLGGHVLKKLGDGLMALFGYPQAQENDGERAVRAALAIQRALADLNARNAGTGAPELAARIGLESGRVVVDSTGEVFGEAPNIAARVQSAAAPGEIWITRGVHRQIAGLFVAEDKGEHELKGVTEKAQLYRIVRASGGGRRGGSRAPTPLVGRAEELDILMRRWERARRGEGQLSLIVGEPGLGKSRLIEEFRARLAETPHTWVEWASSQLLQNTPLHPVAEWGRVRFGGAEVSGEKRLAELEAALGSVGLDAAEYAPLLAPVIDAPLPSDSVPKLSPEELRSRQLAALVAWLLAGARTQPIVLAFEDLHWADPTSLDVLQALAERGAQAPLLIVATTRPEFRPPWKLRSHHGVISLAPLDAGEVARMVGEIAARHALSKDVIAGVSERSGGVPLFVEEVTRLLLERGEAGGVQAIPPTLQQSLAARLDRLGSAREIAQIGAVLGRGFSYALLKSVATIDDRGQTGVSDPGHSFLDAALEKLADAELLFVEGVAPYANYRFKHALIQDAAYDSLLKSRRQTLHRRAAEVLLASPTPEAEALAHHFTQAGQTELAIEWWGKAGDQALRRSAFAEAISHLSKAIELSDKAGGAAPRRDAAASASQRLKLQTEYGQAVMWGKGFAADETKDAFARAAELATQIGGPEAPLDAYVARWAHSYFRGELGLALEAAESLLRGAERAARPTEAATGHRLLGLTRLVQGDFAQARERCEQALRIYDPERDREAKFRLGVDTRAMATAQLALAAWHLGEVSRAAALMDEAVAHAAESAHVPTIVGVYLHQAWLEDLRDDAEAAQRAAEAAVALCREHGLSSYLVWGALQLACARAKIGDSNGGLTALRQALADYTRQGNKLLLPFYKRRLAETEAEREGAQAALAGIDEALALAGETGEHWFDAGLHRIRGEILLKQNPADPAAEAAFLAAIAVAQSQEARSFELRAALSLAKLYKSTGRPIDAHDVLGPALAGFSPTPEFPQIAEAKALFEALAADDRVKAEAARRAQRLKLQTSYSHAVMWSKGQAAEETKAAFARVGELAIEIGVAEAPLDAYFGRCVHSLWRGELGSAWEAAEGLLREAERAERAAEAGLGHRLLGIAVFWQGDFTQARARFQQAIGIYEPEVDRETKFRFGLDSTVVATSYLALAAWCLGDFARARELIDQAGARAVESAHAPTLANTYAHKGFLDILRDDAEATRLAVEALVGISREHGLALYLALGALPLAWVRAKLGDRDAGSAELRQVLADFATQGNKLNLPFYWGLLAEIEAERGRSEAALAGIDEALALAGETGEHWFDAGLHRIRGEILLKQNPADPAPAEAAFLAAIAVAQQQKARSFELRAALSLAKLYQSTDRPIDAHDVLGPALEGFSPTPEFPEIAEAKALFEALAADEMVKADVARRAQRLKLQTDYGQALMWSKGYAAEETEAAFARVGELATEIGNVAAQFDAYYARWGRSFIRGEFGSARETAESFLREAVRKARLTEAAAAHRNLGITLFYQGDFTEARAHFEQTLKVFDPERDREAKFRHGQDSGVGATAYLAHAAWHLCDLPRARELMDEAVARAVESAHAPTLANTYYHQATLEILRDNAEAARRAAEAMVAVSGEHSMALYLTFAALALAWARAKLGDRDVGPTEFRQALAGLTNQGVKFQLPFWRGLLAEIEAEGGDAEAALAGIDEALAVAAETGEHFFDAALHRIRGEILLKQNPADPAPAEAAFLAAIAVAQQQKARSFELRAALSLAKLYQSTGRPIDAHDVLGPALAGFSPTPEFPQIAEAKALFETLAADEGVKGASASRHRRLHLQVAYGNALIGTRGYDAIETKAAFERANELAAGVQDVSDRLSVSYGLWLGSFVRGDLEAMRAPARALLRDCAKLPNSPVSAVGHGVYGRTKYYEGDFAAAREHFEQGLAYYDPERDNDVWFTFGMDGLVSAQANLAFTLWPLGEFDRARHLAEAMTKRAERRGHALTSANALMQRAMFEMFGRNFGRAAPAVKALSKLVETHEFPTYIYVGIFLEGWVQRGLDRAEAGIGGMRRGIALLDERKALAYVPFYKIALAEAEAEAGEIARALATARQALAQIEQTQQRWCQSEGNRVLGEILIKQNPADPAAAEAAFLAAIAVAQQQKARSFELRAALSLAKLYRATGRDADARAALEPALEGFSPTPEFPEVGDAQALVAAVEADARL